MDENYSVSMRLFAVLILIFCSTGCSILADRGEISLYHPYYSNAVPDTLYYPDKKIKATGNLVLFHDSITTEIKTGAWTEYFPNGQISRYGEYDFQFFTTCCFAGPCDFPMSYRTEEWKFFHENGQLKATGIYKLIEEHINTNCWGGDRILKSRVDKSWQCFDEQGKPIKMSKQLKKELESL